jgi:CheY-like chemotaxis protein
MRGGDGLEVVKSLRAHPATSEIPLIVLSSKEEPEIKSKAFALGANDYLVKFPDKLELVTRIRYFSNAYIDHLQRREAFAALRKSEKALRRSNAFIRQVFGRYLSDEVVEKLLEEPDNLNLGGELRKVAILMADLRGFTVLSERLPPEKVVTLLNRLSKMRQIRHRWSSRESDRAH